MYTYGYCTRGQKMKPSFSQNGWEPCARIHSGDLHGTVAGSCFGRMNSRTVQNCTPILAEFIWILHIIDIIWYYSASLFLPRGKAMCRSCVWEEKSVKMQNVPHWLQMNQKNSNQKQQQIVARRLQFGAGDHRGCRRIPGNSPECLRESIEPIR